MKNKYLLLLLVMVAAVLIAVSCTPAPTTVPTQAAPPTAAPQSTTAPAAASTTVSTTVSTTAATTASTTAATTVATTAATTVALPTLPATNATPTLIAAVPTTADDIQVISPQLLKAMIEGGADIAIADAQPPESYVMGHIKGAVNVPWAMQLNSAGGLPMDKLVVVYCDCPPDEKPSGTDAGNVAMQLITNFGYQKIAVLDGGWERWQELGYPTEKGN